MTLGNTALGWYRRSHLTTACMQKEYDAKKKKEEEEEKEQYNNNNNNK